MPLDYLRGGYPAAAGQYGGLRWILLFSPTAYIFRIMGAAPDTTSIFYPIFYHIHGERANIDYLWFFSDAGRI